MGFRPGRGTPQGAVESPLLSMAFNDILMTALKSVSGTDYLRLSTTGSLSPADDVSYVDDLISGSSTRTGIQDKADIMSAFALSFQIQLNTSKFRAFSVIFGNHHDGQETSETIDVHRSSWSLTQVPLAQDGTLSHLGSKKDFNLDDVTQISEGGSEIIR